MTTIRPKSLLDLKQVACVYNNVGFTHISPYPDIGGNSGGVTWELNKTYRHQALVC
jgi:hypothetical protein